MKSCTDETAMLLMKMIRIEQVVRRLRSRGWIVDVPIGSNSLIGQGKVLGQLSAFAIIRFCAVEHANGGIRADLITRTHPYDRQTGSWIGMAQPSLRSNFTFTSKVHLLHTCTFQTQSYYALYVRRASCKFELPVAGCALGLNTPFACNNSLLDYPLPVIYDQPSPSASASH
jgi:hypothetical protein